MLNKSLYTIGLLLLSTTDAHAFTATHQSSTAHQAAKIIKVANTDIESQARTFIEDITKNGIEFLKNKDLNAAEKKKKFRSFLKKNFDLPTIGRFALGKYWRVASKTERKEYLNLFEDMIVDVYSKRFGEYNGQNIEVTGTQPQGKKDIRVKSKIIQKSGPDITIDWRVRKRKSGELKVIDISVEGISMSLTQRSEFASIIQRGGGKVKTLISHLNNDK